MWVIGVCEMDKKTKRRLGSMLIVLRSQVFWIIRKANRDIKEEEIEFNGRWCDDGGKAME